MRPRCRAAAHASCGRHVALRDRVGRAQSRQPTGLPSHRYLLNRRSADAKCLMTERALSLTEDCARERVPQLAPVRCRFLAPGKQNPNDFPRILLNPSGAHARPIWPMVSKRSPRPRCFPSAFAWLLPRQSTAGKQVSDSNHLLLVASRAVILGLVRGEARHPPGARDHDLGRAGAFSALPAISASPKPPSKSVAAI